MELLENGLQFSSDSIVFNVNIITSVNAELLQRYADSDSDSDSEICLFTVYSINCVYPIHTHPLSDLLYTQNINFERACHILYRKFANT